MIWDLSNINWLFLLRFTLIQKLGPLVLLIFFFISSAVRGKCSVSGSVASDSLQPHRLQPARLLCPWNSPGKNTGVGCRSLHQGIFQTQGLNPGLPHCRQIIYHQGSPGCQRETKHKIHPGEYVHAQVQMHAMIPRFLPSTQLLKTFIQWQMQGLSIQETQEQWCVCKEVLGINCLETSFV